MSISPIVSMGYGSWSDVNDIPVFGYSIGAVANPVMPWNKLELPWQDRTLPWKSTALSWNDVNLPWKA